MNQHVPSGRATILAPVFNFDCEEPQIQLSDGLSIRIMHDEDISLIREHERVFRSLPLHVIEKLKFTIDCATEETSLLDIFERHNRAIERINLVTTAFRIWGGVIVPSFLRIMVSNVLYVVPTGKQMEKSVFDSEPLQTITLRSPAPIAHDEMHRFSKVDADIFGQLVRSMEKVNHSYMKVAFSRLRLFAEESWPESVIDAMIAFEVLYSSKTDSQKGSPIAKRAAKLIGKDQDEAIRIESFLREGYRLRNSIVHGEDVVSANWLELTQMAFKTDPDLNPLLTETNVGLPPTVAIELLGTYLCRSIRAIMPYAQKYPEKQGMLNALPISS